MERFDFVAEEWQTVINYPAETIHNSGNFWISVSFFISFAAFILLHTHDIN
jgi:hypothetical protein